MSKYFRPWNIDQTLLLPPNVQDFVPKGHVSRFIMVVRKGKDGHVFVTDGGHWIVDARLGRIPDAPRLAGLLALIPGVVEHGLFIGIASTAILAGSEGIRVVKRR
jgi:ribose 5-phosphate isomerase